MKDEFDDILSGFATILQDHWNSHLHFIPDRSLELDSLDLLWFNEIQKKYFLKIEENNLEIE